MDAAWVWIAFTLMAAFMQSIRTAAQKHLSAHLSAMAATYVRYLYGLPVVAVYLWLLQGHWGQVAEFSAALWSWIVFGGVAQILGTWALVKVFSWRNFAVGSAFSKTEALQAAVLGVVLFGIPLSLCGWLSVWVGVAGIICLLLPRQALRWSAWLTPVTGLGLLCGFCFALSALAVYQASQLTGLAPLLSAAWVLLCMILVQVLIISLWLVLRERAAFLQVLVHWRWCAFVGVCSSVGSIGWFTAMSLQNPALVRTLGQVEFLFTLILTRVVFAERIQRNEWAGIGLILLSVVILLRYR